MSGSFSSVGRRRRRRRRLLLLLLLLLLLEVLHRRDEHLRPLGIAIVVCWQAGGGTGEV